MDTTTPHSGPAPTHVEVKHNVTGAVWDCPIPYLDEALALGWQLTSDPDDSAYAGQTVKELETEIARRNDDLAANPVEGLDPLSKGGNKANLIATLLADDARRLNINA